MAVTLDREAKARSVQRYKQERDWFEVLAEAAKVMPGEEGKLNVKMFEILLDSKQRVVECVENDEPFIGGYYCNAPEVFNALDLPWFMIMETPFMASSAPHLGEDIEASVAMGLNSDLCTAVRLPAYYVHEGMMPVPSAVLGMLAPCDAAPMLSQMIEHDKTWKDVPLYCCDPPYSADERAVQYYAKELREMAGFLEEHTGRTLDIDRLREVCEESNRTYSLWQDYNELRRSVPCPHGWEIGGAQAFAISQCFVAGDPRCTAWFEQLYKCGEERVKAGIGANTKEGWKEKIRLFWYDIMPYGWIYEFMPWLEEEWGAVIVMDMFGNCPYTLIDTSTEETMFHDLAKRNLLDSPMIRQARSTAENFSGDIRRVVKDFSIDCVIWPGHMGHKDGAATTGIMRQTCREIGVPYMTIGLDLFDPSYTSVDEVKDKVSEFFLGMGLG